MSTENVTSQNISLEGKLDLININIDKSDFIKVDTNICKKCEDKPCLYICPAKVYQIENKELVYNVEGCIELGACYIVCHKLGKGAIKWNYPKGNYGVNYKFG